MIRIKDIAAEIEAWAPTPVAESYDNVGLLVGHPDTVVSGVLINLDMTEEVVEEAIKMGVNMIIAHHPIWFGGRKRLNGEDYVSRTIIAAIKNNIALYACHTNLDNIRTGVNRRICDKLNLTDVAFLQPKPGGNGETEFGSGMIGVLPEKIDKQDFLEKVKSAFLCGGIRYADFSGKTIHKVAVCGGAGSFLTKAAIEQEADALVTADITYHKFFDNENRLLLMDIGHYESEQFTSELIYEFLSKKFTKFAIHLSKIRTNPIKYF